MHSCCTKPACVQIIQTLGIVPVFESRRLSTLEVTNRRGEAEKKVSHLLKKASVQTRDLRQDAQVLKQDQVQHQQDTQSERPLFANCYTVFVYFSVACARQKIAPFSRNLPNVMKRSGFENTFPLFPALERIPKFITNFYLVYFVSYEFHMQLIFSLQIVTKNNFEHFPPAS